MKGLLILLGMAINIDASVDGIWESSICEGVTNRGFFGTYNYQFEDGSVNTFFRQYQDPDCTVSTTTIIPQTQGIYELGQQTFGGEEKYHYNMILNNGFPLQGTITIDSGEMQICQTAPNAPCWSYHKR